MNRIEVNELIDPVAIIRINKLYRDNLTPDELCDITCGYWNRNRRKAEKCRLVFGVYQGIVKEVYEAGRWVDGSELRMRTSINNYPRKGSYGFDGHVANDTVRNRFVGRSVAHLFKHGDQTPVRVFGGNVGQKGEK